MLLYSPAHAVKSLDHAQRTRSSRNRRLFGPQLTVKKLFLASAFDGLGMHMDGFSDRRVRLHEVGLIGGLNAYSVCSMIDSMELSLRRLTTF